MGHLRSKLITVISCLFFAVLFTWANVFATPAIDSTSGTGGHGDSVIITSTGTNFGSKTTAKPLMWDDGESQSDGDWPISAANSASRVGYDSYNPQDEFAGCDFPYNQELHYRDIPYAPVSASVSGPHNKSAIYMSGGHWSNSGACFGSAVVLTVENPSTYADRWYATFYYRLSPEWPDCGNAPNHKYTSFQEVSPGTSPWWYFNFNNSNCPCTHVGVTTRSAEKSPLTASRSDNLPEDGQTPPWDNSYNNQSAVTNPYSAWVRIEQIIAQDTGFMYIYYNNELVWQGLGEPDFITGSTGYDRDWEGIRQFSIGGYYRQGTDPLRSHDDAHRFFDDVYIDSSLSRVMLGNNATYSSCTIIEPQPPTAWATNEITITVNQGAIPSGIAYLFVFDSDNNANAVGHEITVGEVAAAATGTVYIENVTESEIRAGGKDIVITLSETTWVPTMGDDNAITTAFIVGITSDKSEGTGWNAVVRANMVHGDITRNSDSVVTVLLGAEPTYDITVSETIEVTLADTVTEAGIEIVATPTFPIGAEQIGSESISAEYVSGAPSGVYDSGGISIVAP